MKACRYLLVIFGLALPQVGWSAAGLLIFPTQIVFDRSDRAAKVNLMNRGDSPGTYEIGWINYTMLEDGRLQRVEDSPAWSVESFVRYSPRRVTLQPGESRDIKLALRPRKGIVEGEYFSHLRMLTLDDSGLIESQEEASESSDSSIVVKARTAVAIPVIWRNSEAEIEASIAAVVPDEATQSLKVHVRRAGDLSLRGYLHLIDTAASGEQILLSRPTPVVMYMMLNQREFTLPLLEGRTLASLPATTQVYLTSEERFDPQGPVLAHHTLR